MGKAIRRKAGADQFDSSDDDSLSSISTTFSDPTMANDTEHVNSIDFQLEKYIDALYEKRGSVRETALLGLAEAFEGQVLLPFIQNKCITLLHQYLVSIKKGSSKEACLASRTIGLLAITVGAGNSAHEIMEESIYPLSQALVSGSDKTKKKAVIDCLALVTFIGANDLIETEASLKIIWQVIYPKSGPNVGSVKKPDSAVLSSAISAWSFLLTTISSWRINPDSWKESISFLCNLLEDPDRSVRIAAGEALGLFFELGILDMNFQREDTNIDKLEREVSKHGAFHHLQGLKAKILARASDLSTEAGGKGTDKKNLNDQRELFQKFLDFVETGDCPETLLKISRKQRFLTTSTWAQMLQLNFLKGFLGKGFLKHVQDNELLHDVFDFAQDRMGILSRREKISKSDDKGWTQKMNKNRKLAQVRKQGHLISEDDRNYKIF